MREKLKQLSTRANGFSPKGVSQRAAAAAASLPGALRGKLLFISAALYAWALALGANAHVALAQTEDPGKVEGTLQNAVQWVSGIIALVAVLGLLICAVIWIFSTQNERRKEKAQNGAAGCLLAILVAFLAPSIVGLLEQWTQGGGGSS